MIVLTKKKLLKIKDLKNSNKILVKLVVNNIFVLTFMKTLLKCIKNYS